MGTQLVKIGTFARSARLTVRALHHYDELGLLHPTEVDPSSGYRLYDLRQLPTAATIATLRQADVDLGTIRSVLSGDQTLAEVIAAEVERHEAAQARAEAAVRLLLHLDSEPAEPSIVERGSRSWVGRSITVTNDENEILVVGDAFDRLFDDTNTPTHTDGVCIIRRVDRRHLYLDIGVACGDETVDAEVEDGFQRLEFEAGRYAEIDHHGPLDALPVAHARLTAWCAENGATIAGCAYEIYLGAITDRHTVIGVPVR